ncbi:MAG: hypothetical protein COB17_06450 [Sulfurimonas sp.]|nr:MAG: hypothetical protein COB17_06450 [Sulfurimonas sp.]
MSDILSDIEDFINNFNSNNDTDFAIDTIRVKFSKQHKLDSLKELGKWSKLKKNSNILNKLKRRLNDDEVTSVYRLETHDIYYYNMQEPPKYRNAMMVIFGIKQYHQAPPPKQLITKILSTLKNISNIDICFDVGIKPNLNKLKDIFDLTQYISKDGIFTDTYYINKTDIPMLKKITIYNKAFKNNLGFDLWRFEAKISIPNYRYLALPLNEFKSITDIAKATND